MCVIVQGYNVLHREANAFVSSIILLLEVTLHPLTDGPPSC